MCLIGMLVVGISLLPHWSNMTTGLRITAIVALVMFPFPCLHLFKKEPDPFNVASTAYTLVMLLMIVVSGSLR